MSRPISAQKYRDQVAVEALLDSLRQDDYANAEKIIFTLTIKPKPIVKFLTTEGTEQHAKWFAGTLPTLKPSSVAEIVKSNNLSLANILLAHCNTSAKICALASAVWLGHYELAELIYSSIPDIYTTKSLPAIAKYISCGEIREIKPDDFTEYVENYGKHPIVRDPTNNNIIGTIASHFSVDRIRKYIVEKK